MMVIRRLRREDLETRIIWMNNPAIYKSMHFTVPVKLGKTIEWFERNLQREDRVDFAFTDGFGGAILAFGGITSINRDASKAETYLFVNPNEKHRGIGTQAKRLMCDYAFNELGLNKLYVVTNENNFASIALQVKFGYHLEGRLREEYLLADGTRKDRLYFGLLKEDWEELQNA